MTAPTAYEIQLEHVKLRLERTKAWLTAAAIILPILASLATFALTRQQTLNELRLKEDQVAITSKIEFPKLITQTPVLRSQALANWKQVFPEDEWLANVKLSESEKK